jgi:hypothetical protein
VEVWYRLVLGVLVTWRLTHLLNAEDGPWRMFARIRNALPITSMLRQLLTCFYCLSVWVAAPLAYLLGETWTERLLLVPALSAAAILVERVTQPPMPHYVEDPEEPDGLLWQESSDDDGARDARAEP